MNCPKCGFKNADNANFCSECGADLSTERFICPKCHSQVTKGQKHCQTCGKDLAWVDADYDSIPIPVKKIQSKPSPIVKQRAPRTESTNNVFKYILGSILLTGLLCLFVGCFGSVVQITGSGIGSLFEGYDVSALEYYFSTVFDEIDSLNSSTQMYNIEPLIAPFDLMVYYGMFVMIILACVFVTITVVKWFRGEENIKFPFAYIASGFALAHLMIISYKYLVKEGADVYGSLGTAFGWGSILILIGLILVIGALLTKNFVHEMQESSNNKMLVSSILRMVACATAFVLALLIYSRTFVFKEVSSGLTTTSAMTSKQVVDSIIVGYSDSSSYEYAWVLEKAMTGFYVLFLTIPLFVLSCVFSIKRTNIGSTTFSAVCIPPAFIGQLMILGAIREIYPNYFSEYGFSLSFAGVFSLILPFIVLGLSIASFALKISALKKE